MSEAAALKAWRLSLGLKESDVAQMNGLTETQVKQIETGRLTMPENMKRRHFGKKEN